MPQSLSNGSSFLSNSSASSNLSSSNNLSPTNTETIGNAFIKYPVAKTTSLELNNNNNNINITRTHSPSPPPKPNRFNSNTLNPKKINLFMCGDYSPVRGINPNSDRKFNAFQNRDQAKSYTDSPNLFQKSEDVEYTFRDSPTCEKLSSHYNKMIQSSDFTTSTVILVVYFIIMYFNL
jgi:hypothetical protein